MPLSGQRAGLYKAVLPLRGPDVCIHAYVGLNGSQSTLFIRFLCFIVYG